MLTFTSLSPIFTSEITTLKIILLLIYSGKGVNLATGFLPSKIVIKNQIKMIKIITVGNSVIINRDFLFLDFFISSI